MKTGFCTLSINRTNHTLRLAESLKQNSDYPLTIYTLEPEMFDGYNVVDIRSFSSAPEKINATFNYNLKGIITNHFYNNTTFDQLVYVDCDVVLTQTSDVLQTQLSEGDLWGVFASFDNVHRKLPQGLKYNAVREYFGIRDDILLNMKYFTEVMFVLNRGDYTGEFLNNWRNICEEISKTDIEPAYECVEFGMAVYETKDLDYRNLRKSGLRGKGIYLTEIRHGKMKDVVR